MMKFTEAELIDLENAYLQRKGVCGECEWGASFKSCGHEYEHIKLTFDRKRLFDRLIAFARLSGAVEPISPFPARTKLRNGISRSTQTK